jgi:hypothetical protein
LLSLPALYRTGTTVILEAGWQHPCLKQPEDLVNEQVAVYFSLEEEPWSCKFTNILEGWGEWVASMLVCAWSVCLKCVWSVTTSISDPLALADPSPTPMWLAVSLAICLVLVSVLGISNAVYLMRYFIWRLSTPGATSIPARKPRADLSGTVSFDTDGPYIAVPGLPGKRIRLQHESWGTALAKLASTPRTHWFEAKIPGNPITKISELPTFIVGLGPYKDPDSNLGLGCRVTVGPGMSVLLSSAHVFKQLSRLAEPALCGKDKTVPFDPDWPIWCYSSQSALDVIGVEVPDHVWSFLGVTAARTDANPPEKFVARVYGYDGSEVAMSLGQAKCGRGFTFSHTASTEAGWSGSPLLRNGKVVGVHRGSCPSGTFNTGVSIQPFLIGEETKDHSKAWTRVPEIDGDYDEFDILLKGRKARVRASRGQYSVRSDPDWEPRGRRWSDYVDEDGDELPDFPLFESRLAGRHAVLDSVVDEAFGEAAASRKSSEFGVRRDQNSLSVNVETRTRPVSEEAFTGIGAGGGGVANSGNAKAPHHSGGVTQSSQSLESTSGTNIPIGGLKGGSTVGEHNVSSIRQLRQKNSEPGQRVSGSPGRQGGRKQKSKASDSKPPSAPKGSAKASEKSAPEQNTQLSSKDLQARVDRIQSELSKPRVSSESGSKAITLLRDLLSYAMRCESKPA